LALEGFKFSMPNIGFFIASKCYKRVSMSNVKVILATKEAVPRTMAKVPKIRKKKRLIEKRELLYNWVQGESGKTRKINDSRASRIDRSNKDKEEPKLRKGQR
jgi:hypothetical protein